MSNFTRCILSGGEKRPYLCQIALFEDQRQELTGEISSLKGKLDEGEIVWSHHYILLLSVTLKWSNFSTNTLFDCLNVKCGLPGPCYKVFSMDTKTKDCNFQIGRKYISDLNEGIIN